MYEIYINDRPLRLMSTQELQAERSLDHQSQAGFAGHQGENIPLDQGDTKRPSSHLIARYTGKIKTLLHYADLLEKGSPKVMEVTIHHSDLDQLWTDFQTHYKLVPAAGGVVNLKGTDTYLFIFRRGYLDLPKGKIDPGETIEIAALREVEEETGVSDLNIIPPRRLNVTAGKVAKSQSEIANCKSITLHTYRTKKGNRVLKPTYWYAMETEQSILVPQAEEGIDWARWMTLGSAEEEQFDFYPSLQHLLTGW